MSYRYMRIIVLFDLPSTTYIDQKAYRTFHKFLVNDGFVMMQESVYCKLALNMSVVNGVKARLKAHAPKKGDVGILVITEKQFSMIEYLVGEKQSIIEDSEERMIIL